MTREQLPDLVKVLVLTALAFPICASRPLLAGTLLEACLSVFTSRVGEAPYTSPPGLNVVYLTSTHKVLTFVEQGLAVCPQGFGHHVDSGMWSPSPFLPAKLSFVIASSWGPLRCSPSALSPTRLSPV